MPPDFGDPYAAMATNPYMQAPQKPDWMSFLGNALTGIGAGIGQADASGRGWASGIGPGLMYANQAQAQRQHQAEQEQMKRWQMGMMAQEYQDKHQDRIVKRQAQEAAANEYLPGMRAPTPSAVNMGPGSYDTKVASLEGGAKNGGMVYNELGSGAFGPFQFMPATYAGVRTKNPGLNLPEDMTKATREQWDQAHGALKTENAAGLKAAGIEPTPQNMYLAHRFGVGGATAVNRADPNKPLGEVLPIDWQRQNPDMRGQTVGGFQRLAGERMKGVGVPYEVPPDAKPTQYALMPNQLPGFEMPDGVSSLVPRGNNLPQSWTAPVMPQPQATMTPAQYTPPSPPPAHVEDRPPPLPMVPKPQLPDADAVRLGRLIRAGAITPEQARSQADKITGDLWTTQKEQAKDQHAIDLDIWKHKRTQADQTDRWRPLTAQERAEKLPGSRPDAQLQINTRTGEVKPVMSARDAKPDVSQYYQDPDVQAKIAAMSPPERAAFNAAASSGDHKTASSLLIKAQTGLSEEQQALSGDALLKTLPYGDRTIISGLVDGSLTPSDLSKRAGNGTEFNKYLALAKQVDPEWSPGAGGARRAFETKYMAGAGQGAATMLAANTAISHMRSFHDLVNAQQNGSSPAINTAVNAVKKAFGEANVPTTESARILLGTEIAKAVRGAGSLNESEEKAAQTMVNPNASPAQSQAALNMLTDFMMGRVHSIEDMAKGHGIPDKAIHNYLSPRSREAVEFMQSNPIGGKPKMVPKPENRPSLTTIFGR